MAAGGARSGAPRRRRVVPAIVFHGDRDATVAPRNADAVVAQSARGVAVETHTRRGQVPGGHAFSRTLNTDADGRRTVVVGGLGLMLWLAHLSAWWWTAESLSGAQRDLALARAQAASLRAEVAGLEADRAELVRVGVLAKVSRCGPGVGRPCIRVNEAAGAFGSDGHDDYRVIQGY